VEKVQAFGAARWGASLSSLRAKRSNPTVRHGSGLLRRHSPSKTGVNALLPRNDDMKNRSRDASALLLPARGEKAGMRRPLRWALVSRSNLQPLCANRPRSESRRGPLTLGRFAPSTSPPRGGGEVKKNLVLAALSRVRVMPTTTTPRKIRPRHKKGGEAPKGALSYQLPLARLRILIRCARLPALHRGTRQAERIQPWLSPRTGFPDISSSRVFCPLTS
jgi:hypothetical protein